MATGRGQAAYCLASIFVHAGVETTGVDEYYSVPQRSVSWQGTETAITILAEPGSPLLVVGAPVAQWLRMLPMSSLICK